MADSVYFENLSLNHAFSLGVYFSEQARESSIYAKKVGAQQKYYMLICKVALGVITTQSTIQPGTHSVHVNTKYVIYNDKQVCVILNYFLYAVGHLSRSAQAAPADSADTLIEPPAADFPWQPSWASRQSCRLG
jgi:hypothetical protein